MSDVKRVKKTKEIESEADSRIKGKNVHTLQVVTNSIVYFLTRNQTAIRRSAKMPRSKTRISNSTTR